MTNLDTMAGGLAAIKDFMVDNVKENIGYLKIGYEWLKGSFFNNILTMANGILAIKEFLSDITGGFSDKILDLPAQIWQRSQEGFQYLFIPSDDYFSGKISSLRERFGFVDCIVETADTFLTYFQNVSMDNPPKFSINLQNVNSEYNWGGEAYVMDFSWYEPYKPFVEGFLSAVLWFFFIWNTYKDLPNIINGVSTALNTVSKGGF